MYGGVVRDRDSDLMFHIRFSYQSLGLCSTCDAKSDAWKKFVKVSGTFIYIYLTNNNK